jgi:predicted nucleotidyltransferase
MTTVDERSPELKLDKEGIARLSAVLDREGVIAAYLFGSQATGTAGPLSDVDLAVWTAGELASRDRLRLQLELMADAGHALGTTEVQVVVLDDASPLLRHRAIRDGRLLVERDRAARVEREKRTMLEYLDTKPLRDELARAMRRRISEGRFGRR